MLTKLRMFAWVCARRVKEAQSRTKEISIDDRPYLSVGESARSRELLEVDDLNKCARYGKHR